MPLNPAEIPIYHITDVANLPGILQEGGLCSDAIMAAKDPAPVIGYDHIKLRRLREITIPCCGNRFVGEFVPFYFCARSPMLFVVNNGRTGRPVGCQQTIVHLVSTLEVAIAIRTSVGREQRKCRRLPHDLRQPTHGRGDARLGCDPHTFMGGSPAPKAS